MNKIPNLLTSLRVILTFVVNGYILMNSGSLWIPVALTALIFLTDFLDGRIARKFSVTTKFGAVFDIGADMLYITSSYVVLWFLGILPLLGLWIIVLKFAEFLITSRLSTKFATQKTFTFDYLGKAAVLILFTVPITAYIADYLNKEAYLHGIYGILMLTLIMAIGSTTYRIYKYSGVFKI